jgi:DNA repair protein RadC
MKLKQLALEERPRERLSLYGAKSLTNTELIAIILGKGYKKHNAIELAKEVLKKNTLRSLNVASHQELAKTQGIGFSKACSVIAAAELGRRAQRYVPTKGKRISSPYIAFATVSEDLQHAEQEMLVGLFLNSRDALVLKKTLFVGTIDKQLISIREIAKEALKVGASKIILAHNHPSGDLTPSDADKITTKKIQSGLALLDLELVDHLIISNNKYVSFLDKKWL